MFWYFVNCVENLLNRDYILAIHESGYVRLLNRARFIFRRPPLSYVSNIFALPFQPTVWIANGIFLALAASLLYVAWRWESYTSSKEEQEKLFRAGKAVQVSWSDNVLIIIGAVSQQGDLNLRFISIVRSAYCEKQKIKLNMISRPIIFLIYYTKKKEKSPPPIYSY